MKTFFPIVLLILMFTGCGKTNQAEPQSTKDNIPNDLTAEEQALIEDVHRMFQERDISVMMARVHKEGVEDWWMKIEKDYLNDVLEGGLGTLQLVRVTPPRTEESAFDGSVFRWSLPLKWKLIIHQPSDGSAMNVSHTISLSEHDGRIVSIRKISRGEQDGGGQPATRSESK
jgi:hypothetical protein